MARTGIVKQLTTAANKARPGPVVQRDDRVMADKKLGFIFQGIPTAFSGTVSH